MGYLNREDKTSEDIGNFFVSLMLIVLELWQ